MWASFRKQAGAESRKGVQWTRGGETEEAVPEVRARMEEWTKKD